MPSIIICHPDGPRLRCGAELLCDDRGHRTRWPQLALRLRAERLDRNRVERWLIG